MILSELWRSFQVRQTVSLRVSKNTACTNSITSMWMSVIDLYSAESWSISTALCVLSGNDETDLSSVIVWSCCCWAPGHGDCPVAGARLSHLQQRRPDDRKCWAGNVVRSGWSDVIFEQLFLFYRIRSEGLLYDAERDLLAIAKFPVNNVKTKNSFRQLNATNFCAL